MKNNLILAILSAAALLFASCRREQAPAFSFENYEQTFDSKQPFSVRMSYIRIVNAGKSPAFKAIDESVRREFFDAEGAMPRTMKKTFDMAAARFREANGCDDGRVSQGNYELIVTSDVDVYDRTLSYVIEGYQYTGGAHGMSWTKALNYSLDDGSRLSLDDFFTEQQKAKLPAALVKLLCMQTGAADAEGLAQMGYYPDDVKPTENFTVSATGITFLYDPYHIGVYAVRGQDGDRVPLRHDGRHAEIVWNEYENRAIRKRVARFYVCAIRTSVSPLPNAASVRTMWF